jgi:hypothetical protein
LNQPVGGELCAERLTHSSVGVALNFFDTYRVDVLLIAKPIKPVEKKSNVPFDYDWGFTMDQYVGVEESTHVQLLLLPD